MSCAERGSRWRQIFSFPALWECLEFYRFRLKKSSMSLGAIRMVFDSRIWCKSPRSQSRYTVPVLTLNRRATSRTKSRAGGEIGSPPRAWKRIELSFRTMREDGKRRCSESVQQKCSKLLSNAAETEPGPTIAFSSISEGIAACQSRRRSAIPPTGFHTAGVAGSNPAAPNTELVRKALRCEVVHWSTSLRERSAGGNRRSPAMATPAAAWRAGGGRVQPRRRIQP